MKKLFLFFLSICVICNAQVFSEDFNSGSTLPAGWAADNPDTSYNWGVGTQNGFASFPSGAAFFDDDAAGPTSINTNARLISPVINLTGVSAPKLSFKYANKTYDLDSILKVEAFNGTVWVQIFMSSGDKGVWDIDFNTFSYVVTTYEIAADIDLTPYANANFQLRFVYDDAGDYSYGIVVDDLLITSGGTLGTSEISVAGKVKVYPNPVKDNVFITSDHQNKIGKVSIIDMSGKTIKTFDKKLESYDLSDLPRGTYIMTINEDKDAIKKKIIKE
ncbi:T9SS-dependent choice-of-anchor J family protein [Chryseobacterium populi]|uniref:Por secretion system C-terminal sorting domain containing protein n=1 Tax=Chryseobacterium populi TaxID=1144316 RepID=J3CPM0_9FLAO|nr:T9SS type A sorting domain-containing protein [Chryseobacterium populi]EJL75701.1 Por secretion system C-terminal sorting domain containing protein [Chryseobacterium populi]